MSHPIDDLFNRGLSNKTYDGLDKDWQEARIILGLEKRKNRPLIWFFFGGLSIAVLLFLFVSKNSEPSATDSQDQIAVSHLDHEIPGKDDRNSNVIIQELDDEAPINVNQDIASNSSEESPATNNQKQVLRSQKSLPVSVLNDLAKAEINHTERSEKLKISRSENDQVDLSSTMKSVISTTENESSRILSSKGEKETGLGSIIAEIRRNTSYETGINALSKLEIRPFLIENSSPFFNEKIVQLSHSQSDTKLNFGIYSFLAPVDLNYGGGLFIGWNLNSKWSFDAGIGLTNFRKTESETFNTVFLDSRLASNASVSSINEYSYLGISIPVRGFYHLGRHSLFAGLNYTRPIRLSGRQELSLYPELADPASPSSPTQGVTSLDPIKTTQNYNLSNVAGLRNSFHSQIGYKYHLSRRLGVGVGASYRWTKQQEIAPLLNSINQGAGNIDRWKVNIRLDYTIGGLK